VQLWLLYLLIDGRPLTALDGYTTCCFERLWSSIFWRIAAFQDILSSGLHVAIVRQHGRLLLLLDGPVRQRWPVSILVDDAFRAAGGSHAHVPVCESVLSSLLGGSGFAILIVVSS